MRGWTTNRKILVVESDDWGTVRMQSESAYRNLLKKGYPVNKNCYNMVDALECDEDIEQLLNTLKSFKNYNGQSPKFTINNIVANPDFNKIKQSGFDQYFYESFTETLKRYPRSGNVFQLYQQGIKENLILPQLHGREHVNILNWMRDLRNNLVHVKDAFDYEMFSVNTNFGFSNSMNYMDALAPNTPYDNEVFKTILTDACDIFESIWGFKSESFIAPCFIWDSELNSKLYELGIKGIQGQYYQNQPTFTEPKYKIKYHYMGQQLQLGQYYLLRNVNFEPTYDSNCVENALSEIDLAFKYSKPAIINSHRLNYIGRINQNNRTNGINKLGDLIQKVIIKYPDIEFMTSNELLKLFMNSSSY